MESPTLYEHQSPKQKSLVKLKARKTSRNRKKFQQTLTSLEKELNRGPVPVPWIDRKDKSKDKMVYNGKAFKGKHPEVKKMVKSF